MWPDSWKDSGGLWLKRICQSTQHSTRKNSLKVFHLIPAVLWCERLLQHSLGFMYGSNARGWCIAYSEAEGRSVLSELCKHKHHTACVNTVCSFSVMISHMLNLRIWIWCFTAGILEDPTSLRGLFFSYFEIWVVHPTGYSAWGFSGCGLFLFCLWLLTLMFVHSVSGKFWKKG